MTATVSITVEPDYVSVPGGGQGKVGINVLNRGTDVGQYMLTVGGVDSAWVQLSTRQLGIFPGDQAAVQARIQLPADVMAATYRVVIAAVNQADPTDRGQAVLNLAVQRGVDTTFPVYHRPPPAAYATNGESGR